MIKTLLLATSITLVTSTAQAEPGRVPSWLMNEPMSLWDWGIYKTDKQIQSRIKDSPSTFPATFLHASAVYEWDKNRIKLTAMFHGSSNVVTDAACVDHIKKAKGAFLDYTWDPKEQIKVAPSVMATLFAHEGGYQTKDQPKDLGEQLANITVMEVLMMSPTASGGYSTTVRCTSPIASPEVSVVKR